MRVIAGEFRSRKILSMPGVDVRPTPDRLRETLFNILSPVIEGAVFVDAYAGTGAVGIEALSRGARHVIFIEKNRQAVELIHQNLASLGAASRARVIMGAAPTHLNGIEAEIVFLDPPYPKEKEYQASLRALEARPPRMAIAQHSFRVALEQSYGSLLRTRELRQGENALSFFSPADPSEEQG
jgi:16S rRNA (guanine966-N2)-methyltransferase